MSNLTQQWDTSQCGPPNLDPNQIQNMLFPALLAYLQSNQQPCQSVQPTSNPSLTFSTLSSAPNAPNNFGPTTHNSHISQESSSNNQSRKRSRINDSTVDHVTTNVQDNQKQNFSIKFKSKKQFPHEQKSYLNLDKELKRCLPNCTIINAFINNNNELVIKTDSEQSIEQIINCWPNNAFTHGVEIVPKKESKFYLALLNVSLDFDIKDPDNLAALQSKYKIVKALRMVKKSSNEPLKTIKVLIKDKEAYEKIVKESKIQIGSTIVKARQWRFNIQPNQCFHCQKIGHMKENCPDKDNSPTCVRCSGKHSHEKCSIKDPALFKCVNCYENHPSCSKQCQALINDVNRKKAEIEAKASKKASSQFNRVFSESNTVYNIKPIAHASLDHIVKSLLNLLIDIIRHLNLVTASVEENPQFFVNLVNKNLGKNYSAFVSNKITSDINLKSNDISTTSFDENDMEYYQDE